MMAVSVTYSRRGALIVGAAIGLLSSALAALIVLAGPLYATGALIGGALALFALSDWRAALFITLAAAILLPFGTLPFKIAITPTLLDLALGAFLLVYLLGWMTGERRRLCTTPVHWLLLAYALWLILAFTLGMRHAPLRSAILRQFAETLLAIGFAVTLVDVLRRTPQLRQLCRVVMLCFGAQALLAIALFILPDATAERQLIRLGRIGYPAGGVIRYIEDNPALGERAIGSWVDPNALGGALALGGVLAAGLALGAGISKYERQWLALAALVMLLALFLTSSRAALLAAAVGISTLALLQHRRLLPVLALATLIFFTSPQTAGTRARLLQSFQGADLATQMRLGEYGDSFTLISRYPLVGIGFSGSPDIDLYADVASLYLIMANQIGLLGLALFLSLMAAIFAYGARGWLRCRACAPGLAGISLALHAALLTVLLNGLADHYFFRLDFQASITLFWWLVGACLAAARLADATSSADSPLPTPP